MGDPNASLPTPQPVYMRKMFGATGRAVGATCVNFMSQASLDAGVPEKLGLERQCYAVKRTRQITKADMCRNDAMPRIDINPETFYAYVDGNLAYVPPAPELPLSQLYWFS
jgi:urease subunit alpha